MNKDAELSEELPPIPFTRRFVVPAEGRRRLAWASVRFTLFHSWGQRFFYATIVAFALVVQSLEGWDPFGPAVRDATGLVLIGLMLSVVWATTAGYIQTFQSTRDRFHEGAVLESGFGDDAFVLRGPTGDTWLPYAGLRGARARGDFVFISTDGIGGQAIFPRALFPDDEVARINGG